MKNLKNILLFLFCLLLGACRKDYLPQSPQIDLNKPVSFTGEVLLILVQNCTQSGCHNTGGQSPDLTADNAYEQLFGLGYVDTTNAEGSILYLRMNSATKPMPPGGKLPADKINTILAWIKQGAQNN